MAATKGVNQYRKSRERANGEKYEYHELWFRRKGMQRHRSVPIDPGITTKEIKDAEKKADLAVAAIIKEWEAEYEYMLSGLAPRISFDAALEKYIHEELKGNKPGGKQHKSGRLVECTLLRLTEFTARRDLSEIVEITKEHIARELLRGIKPGTINIAITHLRLIAKCAYLHWKHADKRRYLDTPAYLDIQVLKKAKVIRRAPKYFLEYHQVMAIIDACEHQEVKDFIWVCLLTGMRRAEVARIAAPPDSDMLLRTFNHNGVPVREKPYTADFQKMCIYIPDQKNGEQDVAIPIIPQAVDALRRFPLTHPVGWHYRQLKIAADKAGLGHAYIHMIRKSCGNILHHDLKVPIGIVALILRNTPAVAQAHYTGRADEVVRETMTRAFTDLDTKERMRLSKKGEVEGAA